MDYFEYISGVVIAQGKLVTGPESDQEEDADE